LSVLILEHYPDREEVMTKNDVYQAVTDRILEALEQGTVPWRKPWTGTDEMPWSLSSGKAYRGVNVLLLGLAGYGDPRWGTYKACKAAAVKAALEQGREILEKQGRKGTYFVEVVNGVEKLFMGGVRKGEKGTRIILWKPVRKSGENAETGETEAFGYLLLRDYVVFNAEQCDEIPALDNVLVHPHEINERAEAVWDGYKYRPGLGHGGNRAFYNPGRDAITMPHEDQFEISDEYYQTLFHEMIHSTGHESRLKRLEPATFGSDPYAKEELVAEIGASMLAGLVGMKTAAGEQSAAYIDNWAKRLKADPKLIVQAAAQSQKAADLIIGTTFEGEEHAPIADAA
jgi:antirestriction protein ArdC